MHDTEWLLAMFHHKNENIIGKGIYSLALSWILVHCEDQLKCHMQKHFEPIKWIHKCNNIFKSGVILGKWKSCLLAILPATYATYYLCLFISIWVHILVFNKKAL